MAVWNLEPVENAFLKVILWSFPSVSTATTAHHYSPSKANSQSPLFQTRNKIQTRNLSHCFYFPSSITAPFRCYQASSTSVLTCRSQMVPVLPFLLVKLLISHISFNKKVVLRTFPPFSPFTHSYKSDHLTYSSVSPRDSTKTCGTFLKISSAASSRLHFHVTGCYTLRKPHNSIPSNVNATFYGENLRRILSGD